MYDRTIPVFARGLTAMQAILAKAEAHCSEHRIEPTVLTGFRLYPDMLPFTRQIQIATDHARRCPARLTGREPVSMADTETTFPELQDRLSRSLEVVHGFTPEDLAGAAERSISFRTGGRDVTMPAPEYVGLFAMPNFYFHLATAYNILRHNGVPLGKSDFLGG
jgi:hypothetical protein